MTILIARNADPSLLRHCEERWRRSNPGCVCGATLDCFAIARNDDPGYSVIARSAGDEAIQAVSAEQIWIASLSLAMTILVTPSLRGALATKQPRLSAEQLWIASLSLALPI